MNRRFLIIISVLVFGGLCIYWLANWFANAPVVLRPSLSSGSGKNVPLPPVDSPVPLKPSQQVRLAIGSLGLPDDAQNRKLGDLITVGLSSAKGLQLVERQSLNAVLRELELNLSGLVRARDAVRVGKLLRADWFLLGSVASAGNSNAVVVRIVDARTGIMRDVGVIPFKEAGIDLAENVAAFVRRCRGEASNAGTRVYLAIGTFEDVGTDSRQPDLPRQLRAHLTAAYSGSGTTLLEREYVTALLQQVHLDLASLTDGSDTNPPPRMQSAFWLVDGHYQSYGNPRDEVELKLRVQRIFGRRPVLDVLRGAVDEPLFQKAKSEIDGVMSGDTGILVPTKASEFRFQMSVGEELSGSFDPGGRPFAFSALPDAQATARRQRNLQEAIRAFETALLLDPTNRQAKMRLAGCLISDSADRVDEGREYYRQVIDEPVADGWSMTAKTALRWGLYYDDPEARARWFGSAARRSNNHSAAEFFQQEAESAERDAAIRRGEGSKVHELAEARLFDYLQKFEAGSYERSLGMDDFAESYGTNREAAAQRLNELLPRMKAVASNSILFLLATLVTFQNDTNSPVVGEFEKTLEWYAEHPKELTRKGASLWSHLRYTAYDWAMSHKDWALSARIVEAELQAATVDPTVQVTDEDKMALVYAYQAAERWRDELKVAEGWSNYPVHLGNSGPWGKADTVVRTSKLANFCRRNLGIQEQHDPREFDLENTGLCFCDTPSGHIGMYRVRVTEYGTFATDADGLWVALQGKLTHLNFELKTNLLIDLPLAPSILITAVCVGPSSIWIGTGGAGLIEFDKASRQCRQWTDKDGLLMNFISSLQLADDVLWIGYGEATDGGLGKLDLPTRHLIAFGPSLSTNAVTHGQPPRQPITALAAGPDGMVWFVPQRGLRNYSAREDKWGLISGQEHTTTIAADMDMICAGGFIAPITTVYKSGAAKVDKEFGVHTLNLKEGKWHSFPEVAGLPLGVSTVSIQGQEVWVGGMGYVALLDPARNKVLKYAYVKGWTIDKIQIRGGYVWAQFDWHLYRAALTP